MFDALSLMEEERGGKLMVVPKIQRVTVSKVTIS